MQRPNPLSVEHLRADTLSADEISDLIKEITAADEARSQWLDNQRKLTQQRYGIGGAAPKGPWPGASDLKIPTQDKAIRRWKPKILSLVFDTHPVAYFRALEPQDVPAAHAVEQFYDWLFKIHMEDSLEECCYLVDLIAHRGFGFIQVYWDYRTEEESYICDPKTTWPPGVEGLSDDDIVSYLVAEYEIEPDDVSPDMIATLREGRPITLQFRTVVADRPRIVARDPVQVIAPPSAVSVEDAAWICVQHVFDAATLRAWAADGRLRFDAVEQVLSHVEEPDRPTAAVRSDEESLLDHKEGLAASESRQNIEVWEIYTWRAERSGVRRRVVYWLHPGSQILLAALPYVFPFHCWPLVKFDHEKTYRRWHAPRGISNMLSPLARAINRLHNARLNAIAIQLAPVFKWRAPTGVPPRGLRFAPGQVIPVTELNDIEPLVHDLRNIPVYTQEEFQTRQYAEDYAGIYDSSLMSALDPTERRTATEVNYVAEQMQGAFALDAKLFQTAMARVHRLVWQLWYAFGPPEIYFRVLNEEMPRLFRKSEIGSNFDVVPSGTPANTNKALELARAREVMQFLGADTSGVVDRAKLFEWYLSRLDWLLAKTVIRGPQEQQAAAMLMGAANELATGNLQTILQEAMTVQRGAVTGNVPGGM